MKPLNNRLQEINEQIKVKLSAGDMKGAERLSAELIETAEGVEAASAPSNPFDAKTMVGKLITSVATHFPAPTATPNGQQDLELVRRDAIDNEHLRLLTIFHFVNAGCAVAVSCFFSMYTLMGLAVFLSASFTPPGGPPVGPGIVLGLFGFILVSYCWLFAAGNIWAARCIQQRRHHFGCLIVAAINCMNVPFGTALGISSIMTLSRDSIRSKYNQLST